jgi:hypothetical protein
LYRRGPPYVVIALPLRGEENDRRGRALAVGGDELGKE